MLKKQFLIVVLLFLSVTINSQQIDYARYIVDTLASKSFKGRGYVDNTDKKAANFIAQEFKAIGLLTFNKRYFQKFKTPVNTFPAQMQLEINGNTLVPGKDYLIDASSPKIKGSFKTINLPIESILDKNKLAHVLLNEAKGKFIIIPAYHKKDYTKEQLQRITEVIDFIKYNPANIAEGLIILTTEKLTWSGATTLNEKPSFIVKYDKSFSTIKNINVDVVNAFYKKYETQNVIGHIEGKNKDSLIVITAHYDHLGMMGAKTMFPGANDNASGIAMLLSLAKFYSKKKPEYSMAFIAFGAEEIGLIGSQYFVEHPLFKLKQIKFLLNFDISGTGDDGIQVVNGKLYNDEFKKLVTLNKEQQLLKQVKIRGEACNSDHCLFHINNVPCFYMYTLGGIKAYHDIYDKAETLPLTEFEDYFNLIQQFIDTL